MENIELLKALAQEGRQYLTEEEEKEKETKGPRKISNEFSLVLVEYPDFIVSKKMKNSTRFLIVMPSAGVLFFKMEENGKNAVTEQFTLDGYSKFSAGMPDIEMPEDFWLNKIRKGTVFGRRLEDIFKTKPLLEMIRKKGVPSGIDLFEESGRYSVPRYKAYIKAYMDMPTLYLEFMDREKPFDLIINEETFVLDIFNRFGLNNARDFLDRYNESLINGMTTGYIYKSNNMLIGRDGNSVIPNTIMKYDSFRDFVLYESVRMGYGMNFLNFFQIWNDTLDMQVQLYGCIKEKYPKDLPLLHNKMSYKAFLMKDKIDEKKFNLQCMKAAAYEGTYDGFTFIAPKTRQDFYDEATQQSNCLAGYVKKFTNGCCLILFMRKDPEQSYITVEIIDGEVNQAKLACNAEPSMGDKSILYKWISMCNKKIA